MTGPENGHAATEPPAPSAGSDGLPRVTHGSMAARSTGSVTRSQPLPLKGARQRQSQAPEDTAGNGQVWGRSRPHGKGGAAAGSARAESQLRGAAAALPVAVSVSPELDIGRDRGGENGQGPFPKDRTLTICLYSGGRKWK